MFATLLGALPSPGEGDIEDGIRTAIRAQEAAGIEPITDGRLWDPAFERVAAALSGGSAAAASTYYGIVDRWRFAAAQTDRAVKQALPGPYSIGRRSSEAGSGGADADADADADAITRLAAERLHEVVAALAEAGCPLVEIEETEAHLIGADERQRQRFREAHERVAGAIAGTHLTLSIAGGSAWEAGLETIANLPYASLAVDLVAGPDNWNLVTRLPGERGVIAGALPALDSPADAKELLLWAARYAAGSGRRGLDRVGLGSAGSWAGLTWEAAVRKLERLGEAARIALTPGGEALARSIDPRAVNARAAATGQVAPSRRERA